MNTGECFGELALINFQRRAARVVTTQACVLGYLEKKDYTKVMGNKYKLDMERKIRFL